MSATSRSKGAALKAAALHWFTFYGHVHGSAPALVSKRDYPALRDIVLCQCHGNRDRAESLIEEIVRAKVPGATLRDRWAALLWSFESGHPGRPQFAPSRSGARTVSRIIALNSARGAA